MDKDGDLESDTSSSKKKKGPKRSKKGNLTIDETQIIQPDEFQRVHVLRLPGASYSGYYLSNSQRVLSIGRIYNPRGAYDCRPTCKLRQEVDQCME